MRKLDQLFYNIALLSILSFLFLGLTTLIGDKNDLQKFANKIIGNDVILIKQEIPLQFSLDSTTQVFTLVKSDSIVGYLYCAINGSCRIGGCASFTSETNVNNLEPYRWAVITDTSMKILNVKILTYHSEYGYEITSKLWLKKFVGNIGCNIQYGNQIDAISGATVSVESLVNAVQQSCKVLQQIFNSKN